MTTRGRRKLHWVRQRSSECMPSVACVCVCVCGEWAACNHSKVAGCVPVLLGGGERRGQPRWGGPLSNHTDVCNNETTVRTLRTKTSRRRGRSVPNKQIPSSQCPVRDMRFASVRGARQHVAQFFPRPCRSKQQHDYPLIQPRTSDVLACGCSFDLFGQLQSHCWAFLQSLAQ